MDIRQLALKTIIRILEKKASYDDTLRHFSKSTKYPSELGRLTSCVVKNKLTLDFYIQQFSKRKIKDMSYPVKNILRLAIAELEYIKNPEYAVINSYVELTKKQEAKASGFVNALLRSFLRGKEDVKFPNIETEPAKHISIMYSHPEWMVKNWIDKYGVDKTIAICEYNNSSSILNIRINTLKATKEDIMNEFQNQNIDFEENKNIKDCLIVKYKGNVENIYGFKQGYWVVQGEASCLTSIVLNPKENENILDICAAPGGKTTHLAALSNDKSKIIALDINEKRLKKVTQNIERLGINSISLQVGDARTYNPNIKFDKILIDAPCSNTGVLGKRADARWNRVPEDIENLSKIQKDILNNASKLLKAGGYLVYSTCSIEQEENIDIIESFLKKNENFTFEEINSLIPYEMEPARGYIQILQSEHNTDGFFIAKLKKTK